VSKELSHVGKIRVLYPLGFKTVGKFGHIFLSDRTISILAAVSICLLLIDDFEIPSVVKTLHLHSENKVFHVPVFHRQG
jgi:hypothetical protein